MLVDPNARRLDPGRNPVRRDRPGRARGTRGSVRRSASQTPLKSAAIASSALSCSGPPPPLPVQPSPELPGTLRLEVLFPDPPDLTGPRLIALHTRRQPLRAGVTSLVFLVGARSNRQYRADRLAPIAILVSVDGGDPYLPLAVALGLGEKRFIIDFRGTRGGSTIEDEPDRARLTTHRPKTRKPAYMAHPRGRAPCGNLSHSGSEPARGKYAAA